MNLNLTWKLYFYFPWSVCDVVCIRLQLPCAHYWHYGVRYASQDPAMGSCKNLTKSPLGMNFWNDCNFLWRRQKNESVFEVSWHLWDSNFLCRSFHSHSPGWNCNHIFISHALADQLASYCTNMYQICSQEVTRALNLLQLPAHGKNFSSEEKNYNLRCWNNWFYKPKLTYLHCAYNWSWQPAHVAD